MDVGLEVFLKTAYKKYKKLSLGVVCNQASNSKNLVHISKLVLDKKLGLKVSAFFGPQHGIRGEKQDNMIESDDFKDAETGLPVYSLYGKFREPTAENVRNIDAFVIDLQDIGTRIYTFMYTMANCMRAAKTYNKKVIILDRPNPIDGVHIEGNILEAEFTSFVGQYPINVRHGMTMGELALLFNEEFNINCDLEIVKVKGWKRNSFAIDWDRDWVPPSPNIPVFQSALIFPGTVFIEGTLVSEGRGTTRPFEFIGAPYIHSDKLANEMNKLKLPGFYFRPIYFQPTFQKWKNEVCGGVQIHLTDFKKINAFECGAYLIAKIYELYPKEFQWKSPPYEYEFTKMPIDLIAGTSKFREHVENGTISKFLELSKKQCALFNKTRTKYLLY
jgi:uncharacterized protein YbbC (DUF1343 family)